MSVVVFVSHSEGRLPKASLEAVYYAGKMDQGDVTVVTYGAILADALTELGNYGATKVMVARNIDGADSGQVAKAVARIAEQTDARIVVSALDPKGKEVAPRVAVRLGAGMVAGATHLPDTDGDFMVRKSVFSGKAAAFVKINTEKKVIAVMPNSLAPVAGEGTAEITDFQADAGAAAVTVKEKKGTGSTLSLPEAELVVSAGRGMKGPENWSIIEDLANALGAATACSRPVADIGWRPHHEHVGQTGIAIRPNLYIAIGISGAIQHLAGVNSSKTIVVINTDPEAPFFKAADYGIVGDAFEVVPKLIESVKRFQAENA